jgi:hypothetical protein
MSKIEDNLNKINEKDIYIKVETPSEEERNLAQILIAKGLKKAQENAPDNAETAWREFENVREKICEYMRTNQEK